jgi:galactoside O-acetyltransferase
MTDKGLIEIIKWELIRWLVISLSIVPGIVGVVLRYLLLGLLIGEKRGFFRIFERVTLEYLHGLSLGRGAGINTGCWINARGRVSIGDDTILGPYCVIHSANHRMDQLDIPIQHQGFEHKPVTLGNNVWLAARVTVLPGVSIGDNAVIGAGAVVTKDIPANAVAVGNPARVIRLRTDEVDA